jgi:hypothetical protein
MKQPFKTLIGILLVLSLMTGPVLADDSAINPTPIDVRPVLRPSAPFYYHGGAEGLLISRVGMNLYPGQNIQFRIGFNDGDWVSGSIGISTDFLVWKNEAFTLGTESHQFSGPWLPGVQSVYYLTTAVSNATGTPEYALLLVRDSATFGGDQSNLANPNTPIRSDHLVSFPLPDAPSTNPPLWFSLDTGSLDAITLVLTSVDNLYDQETSHTDAGMSFVEWVISVLKSLYDTLMLVWSVFAFFFIENLMITLLLIEGGVIAYAMNKEPDIFRAFQRIINTNVAIFNGLILFMRNVVHFVGELVSLVNPMRYILGK